MKLNSHQLTGMLESMFGTPCDFKTPEEVIIWAEQYCQTLHAPVNLRRVRLVYDRIPVVTGALNPLNSQALVKYLEETTDEAILVPDIHSSGKDSLFLVGKVTIDQAQVWLKNVNPYSGTRFVLGSKQNRLVAAASLHSFIW